MDYAAVSYEVPGERAYRFQHIARWKEMERSARIREKALAFLNSR